MNVEEIARAVFAATESVELLDTIPGYLSDDFVFSGPIPEPVDAEQWLGVHRLLHAAFPDLSYNLSDVQVTGNVARTTHHMTATHTGDLDLTSMGMSVIPATGKSIKLPLEHADITIQSDKVVRFHVDSPPDGGLSGVLEQLGVEMPSPGE